MFKLAVNLTLFFFSFGKFLCHDNKDPISRLAERQRCSSTPLQFDFFLFQESLEDSTTERRAAKPVLSLNIYYVLSDQT